MFGVAGFGEAGRKGTVVGLTATGKKQEGEHMSEEVMHPTCKRCGKYIFAVDSCKGHAADAPWFGDYNELTRDDDGYREDIEQERDR